MGQRMVRELTSNTDTIPSDEQLRELVVYCRNDMVSTPTYDVLWQRLTDYQTLRHVEKALLVIEHLIVNGTKKFIRVCLARKSQFQKLSKYVYKIDGSDIGQNVRRRAKFCYELLQKDHIINKTNSYDPYNSPSTKYKDRKQFETKKNVTSYDDYFQTADKEDMDNMKRREREKENEQRLKREREEREKREKEEMERKKKKKSKKKKKKKKKYDDTESEEDEEDEFIEAPKKKKKKKKSKKKDFKKKEDEMDPFSNSNNDAFFNQNDGNKVGVASGDDPFSASEDDPFWSTNNAASNGKNSSNPPKPNKVKSVSVEEKPADDLMDFFNAPNPVNTAQKNSTFNSNQNGFGASNNSQNSYDPNNGFGGFMTPPNNTFDAFVSGGNDNIFRQANNNQPVQSQQDPFGGNPFNQNMNNNQNMGQMTFSAAGRMERDRLNKKEVANNNQQNNAFSNNANDPFFGAQSNNDPFFGATNNNNPQNNAFGASNNNNNNDDDPFLAMFN